MATKIDTIEDLMRVLDSNPEWLEAMRSRLLTRELLAMPQILADFVETTNRRFDEMDRRFEGVDRRFEGVDRRFEGVDRRFEEVDRRFEGVDRRFEEVNSRLDGMDRRLQRLDDRTGILLGAHARNEALKEIGLLSSDMGMAKMRRLWSMEDVNALVQAGDTSGIPANELRSFRRADAIVEVEDGDGRTCYIAAEVSFTVNGRDTTRAVRNAKYVTRFTGERCYPVVMGVHIDEQVLETVESGAVYWYQMDPRVLEVE